MYVTAPQITLKSESHTEGCVGEYAAIGTQSALHVGQSAVTRTGLVHDLILSYCDVMFISVCLFSFVKFRNLEAVVGEMFMRVFNLRFQWSETS